MSEVWVRAERLSKRFLVLRSKKSALRTMRALVGGESLKREHWVLKQLTFAIRQGEKLALIGKNGSGKTTLLRIITGIYEQTAGSIVVSGSPAALFDCSIGFMRELSVVDNLYLFGALHGISRAILAPREQTVLELAELQELAHAPLKDLSMGQVRRLALSVFAQTTSDLLVFDEVMANLDEGFIRKTERYFEALAASDKTVIMTSHDADFLRRYCTRALWLEDGTVRKLGPVDEVLGEYQQSFQPEPAPLQPA